MTGKNVYSEIAIIKLIGAGGVGVEPANTFVTGS